MISVELKRPDNNQDPEQIDIILDPEGLEAVLAQLKLLADGRTDHVHLMSEAWGGTHLETEPQLPGGLSLHHLKFILRR